MRRTVSKAKKYTARNPKTNVASNSAAVTFRNNGSVKESTTSNGATNTRVAISTVRHDVVHSAIPANANINLSGNVTRTTAANPIVKLLRSCDGLRTLRVDVGSRRAIMNAVLA